ncbi:MAG: hypothetical protein WCW02_02550 [Candidatus Buchananbacteria bacterium]
MSELRETQNYAVSGKTDQRLIDIANDFGITQEDADIMHEEYEAGISAEEITRNINDGLEARGLDSLTSTQTEELIELLKTLISEKEEREFSLEQ